MAVVDPWVEPGDPAAAGLSVLPVIPVGQRFAAVVAAVAHQQFSGWPAEPWQELLLSEGVLLDLKNLIPRELQALRL